MSRLQAVTSDVGSSSKFALGGLPSGHFAPLNRAAVQKIDETARAILSEIGLYSDLREVHSMLQEKGARTTDDDRLLLPAALVDAALDGAEKDIVLHGQVPGRELVLSGKRVHVGSGGAAPYVLDLERGRYRESQLQDLYDTARLVDYLENIHFFSRSVVARDMRDLEELDVNTAFASLAGTSKHVCTGISQRENVPAVAEICFAIAGSPEKFHRRPFLSVNINHVVPPLRLASDACGVLLDAARIGLPVHVNAFAQLGASSPVTMAGSLAQVVAEALAGVVLAWAANPAAKIIFGPRPMITDLRTGAMAGGGGEQALLMAAAAQMGNFYGLANSTIAGATDSKIPDAQSGYEKNLSILLAVQAGSNLITQSCGMQASLTGCSFESYVIDNDMLGAILRTSFPIEVSEDALSMNSIKRIASGEGHFLGSEETYNRMNSDFLYPKLADRRSHEEWEKDGSRDMRERARERAKDILEAYRPTHLSVDSERLIRRNFNIRLGSS